MPSDQLDYNLCGLMDILTAFISDKKNLEIPAMNELYNALTVALFGELDPFSPKPKFDTCSCKYEFARKSALNLLGALVKLQGNASDFIKHIILLHIYSKWRTKKANDWLITPEKVNKPNAEFVGFINLGATCYVNSILQQLYMIPEFRYSLLMADDKLHSESVLSKLQEIFGVLYEKRYWRFKPKAFCDFMKIDAGTQKDSAEFLINLLDVLQEALKGTTQSRLIKDMFEISTVTELICKECQSRSENISTSLTLGVEVKHKKNLAESLKSLVSSEILQGENAYQCDKCEKKVNFVIFNIGYR